MFVYVANWEPAAYTDFPSAIQLSKQEASEISSDLDRVLINCLQDPCKERGTDVYQAKVLLYGAVFFSQTRFYAKVCSLLH